MQVIPRLYAALGQGAHTASSIDSADADPWSDDFPAALASIAFMLMLGFVDDVLDLPWRVKLVMPLVATLPLLAAYSGATAVGIPKPLISALGLPFTYIELGPLYFAYMAALVIFCANSINILAGVNGLEAGQTLLVGGAILAHNVLQLVRSDGALSAIVARVSSALSPLQLPCCSELDEPVAALPVLQPAWQQIGGHFY